MWIYVVIGIVALLLIYTFVVYNSLIKLSNKVKEAFATMDVYLKKRWDLIPNIVETVKGYAKHEKETLENITNLRNGAYDKMSTNEKINTNEQLTAGISKLMMLAESYPDLKANTNFQELQRELGDTENKIASARQFYNDTVLTYNNKVEMFPSNLIAGMFKFSRDVFFEANAKERENVSVKF